MTNNERSAVKRKLSDTLSDVEVRRLMELIPKNREKNRRRIMSILRQMFDKVKAYNDEYTQMRKKYRSV